MIQNTTIAITLNYRFQYDAGSAEFKQALDDFRAVYGSPRATPKTMLRHVTEMVVRIGTSAMIEGVGYVKVNHKVQGSPYSGIEIIGEPDFDVE